MKQEIITCDFCGKQRDSVGDRWFKVRLQSNGSEFNTVSFICAPFTFVGSGKDVCGDVCALRFLGRWLEHGNLDEGDPGPAREL